MICRICPMEADENGLTWASTHAWGGERRRREPDKQPPEKVWEREQRREERRIYEWMNGMRGRKGGHNLKWACAARWKVKLKKNMRPKKVCLYFQCWDGQGGIEFFYRFQAFDWFVSRKQMNNALKKKTNRKFRCWMNWDWSSWAIHNDCCRSVRWIRCFWRSKKIHWHSCCCWCCSRWCLTTGKDRTGTKTPDLRHSNHSRLWIQSAFDRHLHHLLPMTLDCELFASFEWTAVSCCDFLAWPDQPDGVEAAEEVIVGEVEKKEIQSRTSSFDDDCGEANNGGDEEEDWTENDHRLRPD